MAKKENPKVIKISTRGSLGLLALGADGLQAWRRAILRIPEEDRRIVGPVVLGRELKMTPKQIDEKK